MINPWNKILVGFHDAGYWNINLSVAIYTQTEVIMKTHFKLTIVCFSRSWSNSLKTLGLCSFGVMQVYGIVKSLSHIHGLKGASAQGGMSSLLLVQGFRLLDLLQNWGLATVHSSFHPGFSFFLRCYILGDCLKSSFPVFLGNSYLVFVLISTGHWSNSNTTLFLGCWGSLLSNEDFKAQRCPLCSIFLPESLFLCGCQM